MVQIALDISSVQSNKSTQKTARKTKHIQKLLYLLESKTRSFNDIQSSLLLILLTNLFLMEEKGRKTRIMFPNQTCHNVVS